MRKYSARLAMIGARSVLEEAGISYRIARGRSIVVAKGDARFEYFPKSDTWRQRSHGSSFTSYPLTKGLDRLIESLKA